MEIRSVGATWTHAGRQPDGRTDMKVTGAFRDYAHVITESKEF